MGRQWRFREVGLVCVDHRVSRSIVQMLEADLGPRAASRERRPSLRRPRAPLREGAAARGRRCARAPLREGAAARGRRCARASLREGVAARR